MPVFSAKHLRAEVYPAAARRAAALPLRPAEHVEALRAALAAAPAHTLVCVYGFDWGARSFRRGRPRRSGAGRPFSGGAGRLLPLLTENILPKAEALLPASPAWRGLAGYSLAGLFAIWALYQTDIFSRAASMSGSLWYPGLLDYLSARTPPRRPGLSLPFPRRPRSPGARHRAENGAPRNRSRRRPFPCPGHPHGAGISPGQSLSECHRAHSGGYWLAAWVLKQGG